LPEKKRRYKTEVNVKGHKRKLPSGKIVDVDTHNRKVVRVSRELIGRRTVPKKSLQYRPVIQSSAEILRVNKRDDTITLETVEKVGEKTVGYGERTYGLQAHGTGMTIKKIEPYPPSEGFQVYDPERVLKKKGEPARVEKGTPPVATPKPKRPRQSPRKPKIPPELKPKK